mmetsp:Transcript_45554/g.110857  ORF Transcript_45554/g.110857 Transcript_45554/m.110857 type:complete len:403 (+) Transcript_45554:78-1286(+)
MSTSPSPSLSSYDRWYQQPAPPVTFTLAVAALVGFGSTFLYRQRLRRLAQKFPAGDFHGSLQICTMLSAYVDHHESPGYAILRMSTKGLVFLATCQINYHVGFWIMLGFVVLESNLDNLRVFLAYWNCKRVQSVQVIADEEARDLQGTLATTLEPTNVYEDLTRPQSIGVMVFVTQVILIWLVLSDTYDNSLRTCFDGVADHKCVMLSSMGSYGLYLLGVFMSCVFFVGPGNSYGKKQQNTAYWLKLFLLLKEAAHTTSDHKLSLKWRDPATEQDRLLQVRTSNRFIVPFLVRFRFFMSYVVNGAGFFCLLHLLPLQVAAQASGMGVVFRAVGMIYLVNLDDSNGNAMTVVKGGEVENFETNDGRNNTTNRYGFLSTLNVFRRDGQFTNGSDHNHESSSLLH